MTIKSFYVDTTTGIDIHNIVHEVRRVIQEGGLKEGNVTLVIPNPGAAFAIMEPQIPLDQMKKGLQPFAENQLLRCLLPKTLVMTVEGGRLSTDPWQNIFLIDYEKEGRRREFRIHWQEAKEEAQGQRGGGRGFALAKLQTKKRMSDKSEIKEIQFQLDDPGLARDFYGVKDEHLRIIERKLKIQIDARGTLLTIRGLESQARLAEKIMQALYEMLKKGFPLYESDLEQTIRLFSADQATNLKELWEDVLFIPGRNQKIVPKSPNQKIYLDEIRHHDLVFGVGPAGTGKTYLAVVMAVVALLKKRVSRIILVRPAVEAGEKLGFLPGDMYEKVSPYLRPIDDALYDLMDYEKIHELIDTGVIEIAPLAFMRGRTLNEAFVILDEAQNATSEQMKMFLTRLGFNSKAVVTGDVTQIDLPQGKLSGLVEAERILKGIEGISFNYFSNEDVVRHPLVTRIVKAYEGIK